MAWLEKYTPLIQHPVGKKVIVILGMLPQYCKGLWWHHLVCLQLQYSYHQSRCCQVLDHLDYDHQHLYLLGKLLQMVVLAFLLGRTSQRLQGKTSSRLTTLLGGSGTRMPSGHAFRWHVVSTQYFIQGTGERFKPFFYLMIPIPTRMPKYTGEEVLVTVRIKMPYQMLLRRRPFDTQVSISGHKQKKIVDRREIFSYLESSQGTPFYRWAIKVISRCEIPQWVCGI